MSRDQIPRVINNYVADNQALLVKKAPDGTLLQVSVKKSGEHDTYYALNCPGTKLNQPRDIFMMTKKNVNAPFIPQAMDGAKAINDHTSPDPVSGECSVPSRSNNTSFRNSLDGETSSVVNMIKSKATKSMKNMFD